MKAKLLLSTVVALGGIVGCSSVPKEAEPLQETVVYRTDGMTSRPKWVKEEEPFKVENGYVFSMGEAEVNADGNLTMAYRIAENNAKKAVASAIEQKLEFVFQNAEEGTDLTGAQARFIGGEVSNMVTSSLRPGKRYFEKVLVPNTSGTKAYKLRVFTYVTMPEEEFKQAVLNAVKKAQGKAGLSADFAEKVNKAWDKLTQ